NSSFWLERSVAQSLKGALNGTAVAAMPADPLATFVITFNYRGLFPVSYEVHVLINREVYLKNRLFKNIVRSDDPIFFYVHEAFESLYPYSVAPKVAVELEGTRVGPTVATATWEYLKWDEQWYQAATSPKAGIGALATFELSSLEKKPVLIIEQTSPAIWLTVKGPTGAVVFDGKLQERALPLFARNGLYNYRVALLWDDLSQPYRGRCEVEFSVLIKLPPLLIPPNRIIVQGELAVFYALHLPSEVKPIINTDMQSNYILFPYEDGYVMYFPTNHGTPPRDYFFVYGLPGEELQHSKVTLAAREFIAQHLTIAPEILAQTQSQAALDQYNIYFLPARKESAPERYYSEPFVLPVAHSKLTTEFGQPRYVNKSPNPSRHSGLDMAAPADTLMVATNRGKVTLAMNLILTGNTLVIDHGQGLFSIYFHMNDLYVENGQLVERGQEVGTVGSTGFSSGPHLHFTMSHYSQNLEPGYFIVGEPITYANSKQHLGR
ncbi:MAG: M23 family metallopeptidase, partial [bacterium]|nr:M23 family metallopeptidase [bacterium]